MLLLISTSVASCVTCAVRRCALRCAGAGKSDPYVKIRVGQGEQVKTDVKSNRLSPRWDETFDLLVYEPSVEVRWC